MLFTSSSAGLVIVVISSGNSVAVVMPLVVPTGVIWPFISVFGVEIVSAKFTTPLVFVVVASVAGLSTIFLAETKMKKESYLWRDFLSQYRSRVHQFS